MATLVLPTLPCAGRVGSGMVKDGKTVYPSKEEAEYTASRLRSRGGPLAGSIGWKLTHALCALGPVHWDSDHGRSLVPISCYTRDLAEARVEEKGVLPAGCVRRAGPLQAQVA